MARVLVIEDDPASLGLIRYLLEAFGHTALEAEDGAAGLAALQAERPDLVVCDVQLPVLDGYGVARRAKEDRELRSVPLVAVTALAMVGDRERVLAAGFDGYIAKPIVPESFVGQLEAFLPPELRATQCPVPAAPAPPAVSEPAAGPLAVAPAAAGRTIVVIDDDAANVALLETLLGHEGYRVHAARTAAAGLALAREVRPDLVLCDWHLPDGDGRAVLAALKADPLSRGVPVALMTATGRFGTLEREARSLGAAAWFSRPVESEVLLRQLAACIAARPDAARPDDARPDQGGN